MIKTGFGNDSLSRFVTFVCFKLLKDGQMLTEVDPLYERTSTYGWCCDEFLQISVKLPHI